MAFPATPVLDDFARPDSSSLGSGWASPVFTGHFALRLVANQAGPAQDAGNQYASAYRTEQTFDDSEVYLTVGTVASARRELYARLAGENTGAENGYLFGESFSTQFEWGIYAVVQSSLTLLGTTFTQSYVSGDAFGLEVIGATLKAYYKPAAGSWAQIGSTQTDDLFASGHIGFALQENLDAPRVDDFGGNSTTMTPIPASDFVWPAN